MQRSRYVVQILLILWMALAVSGPAQGQLSTRGLADPANAIGAAVEATPADVFGASEEFQMQPVAKGVYAAIRTEPLGLGADCNSVFIIDDDSVVVVDTTSGSARAEIEALRRLTDKPVRYVINTHWHDDHVLGDQIYEEAYPGVKFIAHTKTRDRIEFRAASERAQMRAQLPIFIGTLAERLASGRSLDDTPLSVEQRTSYESDTRLAKRFLLSLEIARAVTPQIAVDDALTIYDGSRVIEVRFLGRAHTDGDLVVFLPKERVVVTGDIVTAPIPFVGANQSYVTEWPATLERLMALHANILVPGHGPILRNDAYPELLVRLFTEIGVQVRAGVWANKSLEQIRNSMQLQGFEGSFEGNSQVRRALFENNIGYSAVAAAYRELKAQK